jgi:hypothetical protein
MSLRAAKRKSRNLPCALRMSGVATFMLWCKHLGDENNGTKNEHLKTKTPG